MVKRTKEDAEETRSRLLDAAEHVFYEKGVTRASLAEIAQLAGVTRGAVYWHFKDKVDLFGAMMDRVTLPLEEACNAGMQGQPGGDSLQSLRAVLGRLFCEIETNVRTRRVLEIAMYRVEYVADAAGVRERHQVAHARFAAALERDLAAAAEAAQVAMPMTAALAAMGLQALLDGLSQAWILGGGGFDLQAIGAGVLDTYLRGLGFGV